MLILLGMAALAAGCGRVGDGRAGALAVGFDAARRPIAVGVELQLAVERPRQRGHFCVGHCELDAKLAPLHIRKAVSSRPDLVQVVSVDDSDPRAPLVRIRTLATGQARLSVEAESNGTRFSDDWTLEARPLARIEVSRTTLPANARVELLLRPVDAEGRELYAGAVAAQVSGNAAHLSADRRMAVEVLTGDAGLATLELSSAQRVHRIPLEVGQLAHASR